MTRKRFSPYKEESSLYTRLKVRADDENQIGSIGLLLLRFQHGIELEMRYGEERIEALIYESMQRLKQAAGRQGYITRSGRYEITLVLNGVQDERCAILVAGKAVRQLSVPFEVDRLMISPALRTGIAVFHDRTQPLEAMAQCAQAALTEAETRKVPYCVYANHPPYDNANPTELEKDLDQALDNSEFELFYQPKLNLHTGLPVGAEALIRWRSPTRGLVPPDAFIPVATRSGKIREITWSVLNMALQHAAGWPSCFGPLTVSVNIAPELLEDRDLVRRIADAIAVWDIDPERLILEITESGVIGNMTTSIDAIRAIRAKGIAISVDDFGTGYSSLMNFKNIPATELKIDKSFVSNMLNNASDPIIIRNIVSLASAFQLEIVAEGVENPETMDALANMGITYAQGYFISKPLPERNFVRYINDLAISRQYAGNRTDQRLSGVLSNVSMGTMQQIGA